MIIYDYCEGRIQTKIAIKKWAMSLGADQLVIFEDGSVTMVREDGYICANYSPSFEDIRTYYS